MLLHLHPPIPQSIPGVAEIKDDQNPATWMLEVRSSKVEAHLGVDFAEIYANSERYRYVFDPYLFFQPNFLMIWIRLNLNLPNRDNQELIKMLSTPAPGS